MGKVITIYLSDEEARSLKGFCDENRCTQYSALKTAVKQLLYSLVESVYEETARTVCRGKSNTKNSGSTSRVYVKYADACTCVYGWGWGRFETINRHPRLPKVYKNLRARHIK